MLLLWYLILGYASANSVNIAVEANWRNLPFLIQLVEAVAAHNESLYVPTLKAINGGEETDLDADSDDEWGTTENDEPVLSHQKFYKSAVAGLSPTQIGFVNLNLVNKIHTPRIQAHYDHFSDLLKARALKECAKDSFGETLTDPLGAWVKYGDKYYCSEGDLYALQMGKHHEAVFPYDRVVGDNENVPVLAFYGNPECDRFGPMFGTLLQLAEGGKLRFVWRYVPGVAAPNVLAGYGATLRAKEKVQKKVKVPSQKNITKLLLELKATNDVYAVADEELPELSLKIASLVLESPDKYSTLKEILNNLPLYAPHLLKVKADVVKVRESALKNENKGASYDTVGLYVNGAATHRLELDLPFLINKLQAELNLVEEMVALGFSVAQTKLFFSKFALISAYKESQFRTGTSENRFAVFEDTFIPHVENSGGLVFFNNLETDDSYLLYSTDREETYTGPAAYQLRVGQLPPLRENVHDLIFAINFSSKQQLRVFFTISKVLLDRAIPQQVGVIPVIDSEDDARLADMFYHIMEAGESTEALAFLYKFWEAKDRAAESELFEKVKMPEEKKGSYENQKRTLQKFSIDVPSVIFNGVIHYMRSSNWQSAMGTQINHDVRLLQQKITLGEDQGKPLKSVLYANAKSERNTRVIPKDPSNIRYKKITLEMIHASYGFRKSIDSNDVSGTFWLIGDFNSQIVLVQFTRLLELMESYSDKSLQIRILNTSSNNRKLNSLHARFGTSSMSSATIQKLKTEISKLPSKSDSSMDPKMLAILERNHIQLHQPTMLFNSRYFRLDLPFETNDLSLLLEYEFSQRLGIFKEITDAYPDAFAWKPTMHFKKGKFNHIEWFDLVSSTVTSSFFMEDSMMMSDVSRFDLGSLNFDNSFDLTGKYDPSRPLDVLVVIDPVDEYSQKLLSIVNSIADLSFVNVLVLVQPLSKIPEQTTMNRFYADSFVLLEPLFDENGNILESTGAKFSGVPSGTLFAADVDVPSRWYTLKKFSQGLDLESFKVATDLNVSFSLTKLVVEGFVKDVHTAQSIPGLTFEATKNGQSAQGIGMLTLGYTQLRLEPGLWSLLLKKGSSSEKHYNLLSASENKYEANDVPMESVPLDVFSLLGNTIHPRLSMKDSNDNKRVKLTLKADINVFSIASGKLYEKFIGTMMASVRKTTNKSVKFWLIENFLTAEFIEKLPVMAAHFGFDYELVSYKWPIWLRQQKERHRTVWGFKILFLDVLFPHDLDKVIFVDADQTARTDLQELVDTDLQGSPYGFPPMCESRDEMEGFRFWKQGYWPTVLKDDLKYHISALFVVDLNEFRASSAGDKLRSHYQKLSSDPNSLANLDQDLPNNMQRMITIHTLAQEWLWCETWCSDESKADAKMIDLCSNPLTKEDKLDQARRLLPEWEKYDREIQKLFSMAPKHDEL